MKKTLTLVCSILLLSLVIKGSETSAQYSDVGDAYKKEVDYIVAQQYAQGISPTQFGTQYSIKRIDAAVIVARALGYNESTISTASGFTDVPKDRAWAVDVLASQDIISGKSPGKYGSNDSMTRSEMAKVIASAYGLTATVEEIPFTDVSPRFQPSVAALVENEITQGKTKTRFGGSDNIKRGEFAIFIYKADHLPKIDPPEVEDVS